MNNSNHTKPPVAPFILAEHRIDPGANQIQGPDVEGSAKPIQVEPKAMAVLCFLASRAGETISREEIMAAVWARRVVVEETLTRAISQLRTALSDSTSEPRYIQTVPKQGYRLIAAVGDTAIQPVEKPPPNSIQPPRSSLRRTAGVLALALAGSLLYYQFSQQPLPATKVPVESVTATPARPSVAVMPFRNLSADAESEYFAEGIAEELLNALAGVPGLRVPSHRSSFAFRGTDAELSSIAKQLNVRHVLEGSVRRSADIVRISAQLIDVATDTTVWSHQYDRQLADIFTVQEEISRQVISALQGTLLDVSVAPTPMAHSSNMDAYSLYLQGRYWWMNGTTSNWFYQARDAFEHSIKLDPGFAHAHAGLAYIYARYNFHDEYMPAAEARPRAERALKTALELDTTTLDAYFARAILKGTRADYTAARQDLDRALQINPNSSTAHFLYSEHWLATNRPQLALAAATRALDLDPLSPWVNVNMAIVQFHLGQSEEAMAAAKRALELDPEYTWAYVWQARIEQTRGNLAQAIRAMHHCVSIDPASESNAIYLAFLYLELQDFDRAQQWFEYSSSLLGDSSSSLFWRRFISLAVKQTNPDLLVQLIEPMARLETTTYSLVRGLHAAQVHRGATIEAVEMLARQHPGLLAPDTPVVRPGNINIAIALVHLLRVQGEETRAEALLDAAWETAALFPDLFRWRGNEVELLVLAGRGDEAIAALRSAFDSGWLLNRWTLEQSPVLESIRKQPEFSDILQAAGADAAMQHRRMLELESSGELVPVPNGVIR